jgi:hypothetical protein
MTIAYNTYISYIDTSYIELVDPNFDLQKNVAGLKLKMFDVTPLVILLICESPSYEIGPLNAVVVQCIGSIPHDVIQHR